jgi:hypothetical protein
MLMAGLGVVNSDRSSRQVIRRRSCGECLIIRAQWLADAFVGLKLDFFEFTERRGTKFLNSWSPINNLPLCSYFICHRSLCSRLIHNMTMNLPRNGLLLRSTRNVLVDAWIHPETSACCRANHLANERSVGAMPSPSGRNCRIRLSQGCLCRV